MRKLRYGAAIAIVFVALIFAGTAAAQQLANDTLAVNANAKDGTYQLAVRGGQPIFTSRTGAQIDHAWLRSSDYAHHETSESKFTDDLGSGRTVTVTNSGLPGKPDLILVIQLYDQAPYATVQVNIQNTTGKTLTVQSVRAAEFVGDPLLDLGGHAAADRVLSDSYSEDRPDLRLYDLGKAPRGMHRGVGSQLIYNRESKQSLFIAALTADRLLTYLHLQASGETPRPKSLRTLSIWREPRRFKRNSI